MSSRNGKTARVKESADAYAEPTRRLTKRELEVAEWIAAGKRNREIGEILGCSSRTVQKHVQHILEKLHLETRTAVCLWSYEQRREGDRSTPASRKSPRRK